MLVSETLSASTLAWTYHITDGSLLREVAMNTMVGFEQAIGSTVLRLIANLCNSEDSAHVVNLGEKLRCFAFDVSALLSCGQSFGCIENGDSSGLMNAVSI